MRNAKCGLKKQFLILEKKLMYSILISSLLCGCYIIRHFTMIKKIKKIQTFLLLKEKNKLRAQKQDT